jgi:hypothetical protein
VPVVQSTATTAAQIGEVIRVLRVERAASDSCAVRARGSLPRFSTTGLKKDTLGLRKNRFPRGDYGLWRLNNC